jgi:hypothetical protein
MMAVSMVPHQPGDMMWVNGRGYRFVAFLEGGDEAWIETDDVDMSNVEFGYENLLTGAPVE